MANSKSAKKRIDINKRNRLQNKYYKSSIRNATKIFLKMLEPYKTLQNETKGIRDRILKTEKERTDLLKILSSICSMIDKGTKKSIFTKNIAARKKKKLHHPISKRKLNLKIYEKIKAKDC